MRAAASATRQALATTASRSTRGHRAWRRQHRDLVAATSRGAVARNGDDISSDVSRLRSNNMPRLGVATRRCAWHLCAGHGERAAAVMWRDIAIFSSTLTSPALLFSRARSYLV